MFIVTVKKDNVITRLHVMYAVEVIKKGIEEIGYTIESITESKTPGSRDQNEITRANRIINRIMA